MVHDLTKMIRPAVDAEDDTSFESRDLCLTVKSWLVEAHSAILSYILHPSIIQHGHGTSIK